MRMSGSEASRPPGPVRSTRGGLILCTVLIISSGCTESGQVADGSSTESPVGSSTPTTALAPSTTTELESEQVLQSMIEAWANQADVGVAAGARFADGSRWLGAAGLADREAGRAVDTRTSSEWPSRTRRTRTSRVEEDR